MKRRSLEFRECASQPKAHKPILIEGYTPEEILGLPPEQFKTFVFTGKPLVFKAGSAQFLGEFDLRDNRLVIELAHIDGGGEGALSTIAVLAEKYALLNNLEAVEWIVHAVRCANPKCPCGEASCLGTAGRLPSVDVINLLHGGS